MFLDMERVISEKNEFNEYILYFPMGSWVSELKIGIEKDAIIENVKKRKGKKSHFTVRQ